MQDRCVGPNFMVHSDLNVSRLFLLAADNHGPATCLHHTPNQTPKGDPNMTGTSADGQVDPEGLIRLATYGSQSSRTDLVHEPEPLSRLKILPWAVVKIMVPTAVFNVQDPRVAPQLDSYMPDKPEQDVFPERIQMRSRCDFVETQIHSLTFLPSLRLSRYIASFVSCLLGSAYFNMKLHQLMLFKEVTVQPRVKIPHVDPLGMTALRRKLQEVLSSTAAGCLTASTTNSAAFEVSPGSSSL